MLNPPNKKFNWFQARSPFVLGLSCMLAAGLFIWFKLRLVTGMPRSAYAVPEKVTPPAPPKSDSNDKNKLPDQPPATTPGH